MKTITLEGKEYEAIELPWGPLRKAIAMMNRAHRIGGDTEEGMAEITKVIGLVIGKSLDEMDAMKIAPAEWASATYLLPSILRMEMVEVRPGEIVAGMGGANSTATS